MTTGSNADAEVLQGNTGNIAAQTENFITHLIPNYIGPRTAQEAGNTTSIAVLSRVGGPVTRTDGALIEQRDEMRNYRIVGRLPYRQASPPDALNNPIVKTVGQAVVSTGVGKLIGALFGG